MILTIGGAPEFSDAELASKEIDATLKQLKKKPKDIKIVYGIGETKTAGEGGYFYAQQWADSNGVPFRDGSPKFREHGKKAVEKRNDILSDNSDAFILFVKGNSTGGNGIIKAFEDKKVPVYRIEQKEPVKDTTINRKVYSKIAKGLLESSVTLDVETTGLSRTDDEIVEIAVVNAKTGKKLFNSFVYTTTPINPHAFLANNITPDMIEGSPEFPEVWEKVKEVIGDKIIVASNSIFDEEMVCFGLAKRGLDTPSNLWTCLQKLYCKYTGQKASKIKTEKMARQLGIEPGTHRALTDAQAQAKILKAMAKGVVPDLTKE
jgi:DNA polymerase III epsilon subunit-like protein